MVIAMCPPGRRNGASAGEDSGEPGQQAVVADVGEVAAVEGVAVEVVVLLHPGARGGGDLAVGGRPVGRRGDHERGLPEVLRRQQRGELAGVAVEHPPVVLDAGCGGRGPGWRG